MNKKMYWVLATFAVGIIIFFSTREQPVEIIQSLNNKTVVYSASVVLGNKRIMIIKKEVDVTLVPNDGYPDCVVSQEDWDILKKIQEDLDLKLDRTNKEIDKMFGKVDILELNYDYRWGSRNWFPDNSAWSEDDINWWCDGQDIVYIFESSISVPWKNQRVVDNDGDGYEDIESLPTVEMTESNGYFYFDVSNLSTGAHLGFSFDGDRLYNLVEGIMFEDAEKLKLAKSPLPTVEKSYPIESLNTQEIASFVVNQEDHKSRDIFVKIIEAVLPLSTTEPSFSFVQSSNQSGNQTHGSVSGTQDGNIGGLMMGGWGFISGSLEGSLDGSIDSKPVMLIRGSVYIVPKP